MVPRLPSDSPMPSDLRSRLRRCLWLLAGVWLLSLPPLQAQNPGFRHFDHRDGLPQSQVMALLEDRSGFIWVGTLDAVARLGPSGFQAYGALQGLKARQVWGLMEDSRGGIWVSSPDQGVAEIRGSRVRNFGPEEGLQVQEVFSLVETPEGGILAGTRLGLFLKKADAEIFERMPLEGAWAGSPIFTLARDPDGRIWLGSRKGMVGFLEGRTVRAVPLPGPLKEESVFALQTDPRGRLWAVLRSTLLRLQGGQWVVEPLPGLRGPLRLNHLQFAPSGEMLLPLGPDGLYLKPVDGPPQHLTYRDGLPRDSIFTALRDRHGALWVGSNGGGLSLQPSPGLLTLDLDPATGLSLGLGSVTAMLEVAPGRMLLGSNTGLCLWEKERGVVQRWGRKDGLPSVDIWVLATAGPGRFWVGTGKGLVSLEGGRIRPGPKALSTALITAVVPHLGRLWVATDEGLFELDTAGRVLARHQPPQEVGQTMTGPLIRRPWGLLVGTPLGLYTFRNGNWNKAFRDTPTATLPIMALHEDPDGTLWVGTTQGLFGIPPDERNWVRIGQTEGLLDETIHWVTRTPGGILATGLGRGGVALMEPGKPPVSLTRALGLVSDETNQEAVLVDSEDRLWIGMVGGISILRPDFRPMIQALPPPRVLEVAWSGGAAWLPGQLVLPPRPGRVVLTFDTGLPAAAAPPRYQVWVEGLDTRWQELEPQSNVLQIAQLTPGLHRVRLRASLDGHTWTEGEPFDLRVRPAWFQHRGMQALLALAGVALIAALAQVRMRRLRQQARALEDRVQERTEALAVRNKSLERLHHQLKQSVESRAQLMRAVSHDLRSPLTSILLTADRLSDTLPGATPGVQNTLSVMVREAHRLEAIVRNLLDQGRQGSLEERLNLRLCHPSEVLLGLTDTLRLKAEPRDLQTQLDLDPADARAWILADTTALQQILFNLLENALKFTPPGGTVGVVSQVAENDWQLEVWDTGRGIPKNLQEQIFEPYQQVEGADAGQGWGLGLNICRTLATAHQGSLTVESEPGRGARFRLALPLVKAQS